MSISTSLASSLFLELNEITCRKKINMWPNNQVSVRFFHQAALETAKLSQKQTWQLEKPSLGLFFCVMKNNSVFSLLRRLERFSQRLSVTGTCIFIRTKPTRKAFQQTVWIFVGILGNLYNPAVLFIMVPYPISHLLILKEAASLLL